MGSRSALGDPPSKTVSGLHGKLAGAAASRVITLGLGTISSLITTTIVIRSEGLGAFAAITLLSSMASLVPYADLGVGTAVVNAVSDSHASGDKDALARTLRACMRTTGTTGVALAAVSVTLYLTGAWPTLLGQGAMGLPDASLGAMLLFTIIGVTVPIGLAQRMLIGASRVSVANLSQCPAPVLSLIMVAATAHFDQPPVFYILAPFLGTLVSNALAWPFAVRSTGLDVSDLFRGVVGRKTYSGVLAVGMPSLVIVTATAATYQSSRLMLSHFSTPAQLASYALVAPIWVGLTSVVSTTGQTLWPYYRQARMSGSLNTSEFLQHLRLFTLIGVLAGVSLPLLGAGVIELQTSGAVRLPWWALVCAGIQVLAQATMLPFAMFLTAPGEWRVQSFISVGTAVVSVASAVLLTPPLGAPGAYLSAALAVFCWQLPANVLLIKRSLSNPAIRNGASSPSPVAAG